MVNRIQQPYKGFSEPERFVEIPSGTGAAEIRRRLVEAGVVSDELAFRAALMWTGQSRALKAGEYRFDRPMSVVDVVEKLARGDVYGHPITFPEGLTIREMAEIVESRGFGKADEFIKAARDGSLVNDLDPAAKDLEGYLFPETYTLPRGTPVATLVSLMVERFRDTYTALEAKRSGQVDLSTETDRDARVAGREGNRQGGRAAARCGGLPESSGQEHGDAGRPDRRLCAREGRHLRRQHSQARPLVRLALQHL